jgi:amphi-Trp domain-containing protein
MSQEVVIFESEEKMSRANAAAFLRTLTDRLETGTVTLKQGEESVDLAVPENVVLEVKAEEEDKKSGLKYQLEVELEWYEGDEKSAGVELP